MTVERVIVRDRLARSADHVTRRSRAVASVSTAGNAEGLAQLTPYTIRLMHAYHLHVSGQAAQAAAQMNEILDENQKAITGGVDWPIPFVQNAAIHALRGESTAALDWLDRAYAAGWRERTLAIDPLFASVRKEPRFTQLLSRIQADVTAMRARADYSGLGLN